MSELFPRARRAWRHSRQWSGVVRILIGVYIMAIIASFPTGQFVLIAGLFVAFVVTMVVGEIAYRVRQLAERVGRG